MKYKYQIIIGLLCLIVLQHCTSSSASKERKKIVKELQLRDSLQNERIIQLQKTLKLELLKTERRIVLDEFILDKPNSDTKQYESKLDSLIKELE